MQLYSKIIVNFNLVKYFKLYFFIFLKDKNLYGGYLVSNIDDQFFIIYVL